MRHSSTLAIAICYRRKTEFTVKAYWIVPDPKSHPWWRPLLYHFVSSCNWCLQHQNNGNKGCSDRGAFKPYWECLIGYHFHAKSTVHQNPGFWIRIPKMWPQSLIPRWNPLVPKISVGTMNFWKFVVCSLGVIFDQWS